MDYKKIYYGALDQFQKESSRISFDSVGVRQYLLISCVPLHRVLPPLLHILLGLGNNMYSKFKEYVKLWIKLQSLEEIAALNMVLLAKIKHDEGIILFYNLQNKVRDLVQDRPILCHCSGVLHLRHDMHMF